MTLKVGLAQLAVQYDDIAANEQQVTQAVAQAARANCQVVVLPEMWRTGYAFQNLQQNSDLNGQATQTFLANLAQRYQIAIVGGSVATQRQDKFYNTMYTFDATGQGLSQYDKVHLFGLMAEDQYLAAGAQPNLFQLQGIPAAGIICYDLRFPEWIRCEMATGAQVLFVVAEWPTQRIQQWQQLLAARAIENQAFVVAVNCVGENPNDQFGGHSVVYDPLGQVVTQLAAQPSFTTATLDFQQVATVRGGMPVFADRRPELYQG
jgi:predicted amidohydrolase